MYFNFDGLFEAIFTMCAIVVVVAVGITWYFSSSDTIETKKRIVPEMKIVIENGVADTTFVYRKP